MFRKFFLLITSFCLIIVASFAFAENENLITIKLYGGYNAWVLGGAIFSSSSNASISAGGFSFGGDFLFGDINGIQFGIEASYLPMLSATEGSLHASITMIPLTANVVFNNNIFYTDLGLGLAFMGAAIDTGFSSLKNFAPSPAFIAKIGIGLNIKLNELIGIDGGLVSYLPFTDFGLTEGKSNFFLNMIGFWQLGLKLGISLYL